MRHTYTSVLPSKTYRARIYVRTYTHLHVQTTLLEEKLAAEQIPEAPTPPAAAVAVARQHYNQKNKQKRHGSSADMDVGLPYNVQHEMHGE